MQLLRCLDDLQFKCIFHKQFGSKKCTVMQLLRCLDDLQFKCIFHKQSGSKNVLLCSFCDVQMICSSNVFFINNSDLTIEVKAVSESGSDSGSESEKNNFGSTTLLFGSSFSLSTCFFPLDFTFNSTFFPLSSLSLTFSSFQLLNFHFARVHLSTILPSTWRTCFLIYSNCAYTYRYPLSIQLII